MIRANVLESEEQAMARFLNGLNYPIKKIVEFQPYNSLVALVHQATKAERQIIEDAKYAKQKAFFASKPTSSTPPMAQAPPTMQNMLQDLQVQTTKLRKHTRNHLLKLPTELQHKCSLVPLPASSVVVVVTRALRASTTKS